MTAQREPQAASADGRLPVARLAPAGPRATGAAAWAARGAFAALALAAAWWGAAWLRPLPRPVAEHPSPVPAPPALLDHAPTMEEREARLAALTASNTFALDRSFWAPARDVRTAAAESAGGAEAGAEEAVGAPPAPAVAVGDAPKPDPWSAAITDPASVRGDMLARIKEVDFKGVYSMGGEPTALIGLTKDRPRLSSMRVGDTFDDGAWRVAAIDDVRDRVLLTRDGRSFEFQLYQGAVARADSPPEAAPPDAPAGVSDAGEIAAPAAPLVARRSIEDVRRELAEAGVGAGEIDELLELAQSEEAAGPGAPPVALAPGEGADGADAPANGDAAPVGIGAILQLMKSNPTGASEEKREPARRKRRGKDGAPPPRG